MIHKPEVALYPVGSIDSHLHKYAVICAFEGDKLLLVKTNGRQTWEMPGGHREPAEDVNDTARRELNEETGAIRFELRAFADYSVTSDGLTNYGRLFSAKVFDRIVPEQYETDEVGLFDDLPDNLTYPDIQPILLESYRQHDGVFYQGK